MKMTKLNFNALGIKCEVETDKLKNARKSDNRGYATFNAVDETGEEVCIPGSKGNPVVVQILLNDTTVKSKGAILF
jgi:hypothetical protein